MPEKVLNFFLIKFEHVLKIASLLPSFSPGRRDSWPLLLGQPTDHAGQCRGLFSFTYEEIWCLMPSGTLCAVALSSLVLLIPEQTTS